MPRIYYHKNSAEAVNEKFKGKFEIARLTLTLRFGQLCCTDVILLTKFIVT